MKKTRLIEVLRSFDKKELRELKKWLNSPFHNQREDVRQLYTYLIDGKRLNKDRLIEKEKIFVVLYPGEQFDDAKMRQVSYFFMKAMEAYLVYASSTEDDLEYRIRLARIYNERELKREFESNLTGLNKMLSTTQYIDSTFHKFDYQKNMEESRHLATQKRRVAFDKMQEVSQKLDTYFLSEKLQTSLDMLTAQSIYKTEFDFGILDDILKYIEENELYELPSIGVYYYTFRSLAFRDKESYYWKLKDLLMSNLETFRIQKLKEFFVNLINYCVGKMNLGKKEFIRESFELYKTGFDKEILTFGGKVTVGMFINVVSIGSKLNEFTWIENFINKYQGEMMEKDRLPIVNLSRGILNYYKKDYESAENCLVEFSHQDILLNLMSRSMLLRVYYKMEKDESLELLIDSMGKYLMRKEIVGYARDIYKNNLSLMKKLVNLNVYDSEDRNKFKTNVQEINPMTNSMREWFLEQVQ
jgi:hypothetical protein